MSVKEELSHWGVRKLWAKEWEARQDVHIDPLQSITWPAPVSVARAAIALCDFSSACMAIYYSTFTTVHPSFCFGSNCARYIWCSLFVMTWNHISLRITKSSSLIFSLIGLIPNPSCLTLATSYSGHWWADPAPDCFDPQQGGVQEGTSMAGPGMAIPLLPVPHTHLLFLFTLKPTSPCCMCYSLLTPWTATGHLLQWLIKGFIFQFH